MKWHKRVEKVRLACYLTGVREYNRTILTVWEDGADSLKTPEEIGEFLREEVGAEIDIKPNFVPDDAGIGSYECRGERGCDSRPFLNVDGNKGTHECILRIVFGGCVCNLPAIRNVLQALNEGGLLQDEFDVGDERHEATITAELAGLFYLEVGWSNTLDRETQVLVGDLYWRLP